MFGFASNRFEALILHMHQPITITNPTRNMLRAVTRRFGRIPEASDSQIVRMTKSQEVQGSRNSCIWIFPIKKKKKKKYMLVL